jgi:hypothetical protein
VYNKSCKEIRSTKRVNRSKVEESLWEYKYLKGEEELFLAKE